MVFPGLLHKTLALELVMMLVILRTEMNHETIALRGLGAKDKRMVKMKNHLFITLRCKFTIKDLHNRNNISSSSSNNNNSSDNLHHKDLALHPAPVLDSTFQLEVSEADLGLELELLIVEPTTYVKATRPRLWMMGELPHLNSLTNTIPLVPTPW